MNSPQIEKGWKSIKILLKSTYGSNHLIHTIRKLEKANIKTTLHLNKIIFYKRCKQCSVIPKGMQIKITSKEKMKPELIKSVQILEQKRLKSELNSSFAILKSLKTQIHDLEEKVQHEISDLFPSIQALIQEKCRRTHLKTKSRHISKLSKLTTITSKEDEREISRIISVTPKCVENLSSRTLSNPELATLSMGHNFAIPQENAKKATLEMMIHVEKLVCELDDEKYCSQLKDTVKNEVHHALRTSFQKNEHPKIPNWIKTSLHSLNNDPTIIITKADKGNMTVLMDKADYEEKMLTVIKDGPYEELDTNPMKQYHKKIKTALLKLKHDDKIDQNTYNSLRPSSEKCPILYGLPKIHKSGIPMRPIVDYRNTPGHQVSIFLKHRLKCVIRSHQNTLKNSYDFVDKVKQIQLEPLENMVSYDVSSLFTNVPLQEAIAIIMNRLLHNPQWKPPDEKLSLQDIHTLLSLVSENYITWRSRYFKQTNGTPMGSPLSPLIAEVFLQDMELKILPTIPYIKIWLRMVDDVFAIVRKRKENELLTILNTYHEKLKFTTELEENGILNFLDVTLTRKEDGTLGRKVYRKPTHTDRYLDWKSHHHISQKIGVVDSLTIRAIRICDNFTFTEELQRIENSLKRNGYPKKIIQSRILLMQTRLPKPANITDQEERWCAIPFIGPITYQIAGLLRKYLDVNIGYFTGPKLNRILNNYKDPAPITLSGVYRFFCSCGTAYIGETANLERRRKEHEGDLRNERKHSSAPAEHEYLNPTHKVVMDSIVLLYNEKRHFPRTFMEAIFIQRHPNNMNRNTGLDISSWLPFAIDLIE